MKHLLLPLIALLQVSPVWSENKLIVKRVAAGEDPNGVVYALPKTVVAIDLTIKKTTVKAGKHVGYTSKFFDLKPDDYPIEDSVLFAADSAALKSRQVADTEELYRVNLTKEWMKDHHFALEIAEDGTLTKGEITITNRRTDFFLSILGTVASIAGKFIGAAVLKNGNQQQSCEAIIVEAAHDPAGAAAAPDGAKRAFCEIVKLSRRRQEIVFSNNAVPDGVASLLQDIDLQLKKLFSENFTGARSETTWTTRFEDVPAAATVAKPVDLLVFYEKCGVKSLGAGWIDPQIQDGFGDSPKCEKKGAEHTVALAYGLSTTGSLHSKFNQKEPPEHSFAFRIPASYQGTIKDSYVEAKPDGTKPTIERLVARGTLSVAQLGVVAYMPSDVGGKKSSITVTLHASGALKTVDIGVEAQGNIAETAGTAATALVDAELARRKTAKDEADEVAQAEKKQKLLEAQVAAMRAQCILDGKCPLNPE